MAKKKFTLKEAKEIGEKLNVDWSKWDVKQFKMGLDVELEHGIISPETNITDDDPIPTAKIALAHLNEIPDYYNRLAQLEKEGKEYWDKKENKNKKVITEKTAQKINFKIQYY